MTVVIFTIDLSHPTTAVSMEPGCSINVKTTTLLYYSTLSALGWSHTSTWYKAVTFLNNSQDPLHYQLYLYHSEA